jgi:hypothetical protein
MSRITERTRHTTEQANPVGMPAGATSVLTLSECGGT